ncbi:MAG: hypothetical protein RL021_548, partial [Bacteroidota bacterium]
EACMEACKAKGIECGNGKPCPMMSSSCGHKEMGSSCGHKDKKEDCCKK